MDKKAHQTGNYTWLERTGMFFKNPELLSKPKSVKAEKKEVKQEDKVEDDVMDEKEDVIQDGGEF